MIETKDIFFAAFLKKKLGTVLEIKKTNGHKSIFIFEAEATVSQLKIEFISSIHYKIAQELNELKFIKD